MVAAAGREAKAECGRRLSREAASSSRCVRSGPAPTLLSTARGNASVDVERIAVQRQKRVTAKGGHCSYAFLPLDGTLER